MSTCGCFSPLSQWLKSTFGRKDKATGKVIEIGPPTDFRKEEFTMPFLEDDESTLHRHDSHGVMTEKEAAQNAAIARNASTKGQLRKQVLRFSARLTA